MPLPSLPYAPSFSNRQLILKLFAVLIIFIIVFIIFFA